MSVLAAGPAQAERQVMPPGSRNLFPIAPRWLAIEFCVLFALSRKTPSSHINYSRQRWRSANAVQEPAVHVVELICRPKPCGRSPLQTMARDADTRPGSIKLSAGRVALRQRIECGSVAEAARRFDPTAAAVAARARSLEEDLDAVLIQRSGRQVHPTSEGLKILESANAVQRCVRDMQAVAQRGETQIEEPCVTFCG